MSFDSLLRHTVSIIRYSQGSADDYGQPSRTPSTFATVKALVQPRASRLGGGQTEEVTTYGAGTQVTDHTVFMRVINITAADEIEAVSAGIHSGKRFEIKLVRDAGGQDHHLEVDCRLINPDIAGSGS